MPAHAAILGSVQPPHWIGQCAPIAATSRSPLSCALRWARRMYRRALEEACNRQVRTTLWRKGSVKRRKLTFTLSEAATATVVVKEFIKGRKKPVRRGKATVNGRAGSNVVRIARRLLKQGRRYRLVISAVDVAGNASGRVTVKLTLR